MILLTVNAILSFVIAMVVHEIGHWVAARACKVPVTEAGLGWGPTIAARRICGVDCQIRVLPLGAFTRMDMTTLQRRPLSQQLFVLGAGIGVNLILAVVAWGTEFGFVNLVLAVGNLLPLYQLDGWKGGMVICRRLLRGRNSHAEWAFTIVGALLAMLFVSIPFLA